MENNHSFAPLLLVIFLAFLVPLVLARMKRLRLPIVVGEIIAGMIVGRSGFNWVNTNDPILVLLAEIGFVFLMFLSGMEIDFSKIGSLSSAPDQVDTQAGQNETEPALRKIWRPLPLGLITFSITLILSIVVGELLLHLDLASNPWMMALILSTTSLGVVLPVLKERGLSSGRYGQTILIAALIADFATMLLITVLVAQISHGLTVDILLIGILFVAFFLFYHVGSLFFNGIPEVRRILEELSHATAQIKVRAAFAVMLMFVVLSQVLGAEIILGAFLAGAVVTLLRTPEDEHLVSQLEAIGFGFFIPIFFIKVGIDFNLAVLLSSNTSLLLVPVLLVAALLVKYIPTLLFRATFSWRETLAAGTLLSARLSLIIAASAIGLRLNIISEPVNAAIILVAILTVTLSPLLFVQILPRRDEEELQLVVVAGADELGIEVARNLMAHNEDVLLIDLDETRVDRARQRGLEVKLADPTNPGRDLVVQLDQAKALVCTYDDVDLNYQICLQARTVFGIPHVVAQVNSPRHIGQFELLGAATMNAALDRAALLVLLTRNPAMYELLTRTSDSKEVYEVVVCNRQVVSKALHQINLPGDLLVLALRRQGELLVPHGNTYLEEGDHLTLVGSLEFIEEGKILFCRD
ncbi:MAG: monovalent cation:proton antiporter family protein [Anaerolineales bacterium]|jgi:Kef-type K+ transport system membrane component KefB/Trk K+ transport system NAD-binding subunit